GTGISLNAGTGAVTITNTGVLSVVGGTSGSAISGALTLANSTTASTTITIDNAAADGTTKGIAAFNATNFSASTGVVNTIQNISNRRIDYRRCSCVSKRWSGIFIIKYWITVCEWSSWSYRWYCSVCNYNQWNSNRFRYLSVRK